MLQVGLMGGTFNPVHLGHLHVAEEARIRLGLDRILFIPNQVAPHRTDLAEIAPSRDRYVMTCMAVNANPLFDCSPVELERPEVSYTFDTLTALRRRYPDREFTFLAGSDSLIRSSWHRLDDVLGLLHTFQVVSRPGCSRQDLESHLATLDLSHRDRVSWLEIPGVEISATDIRARIRGGQAWRYLVPEPVHEYICRKGLYSGPHQGP